jgi:hypothetical protein
MHVFSESLKYVVHEKKPKSLIIETLQSCLRKNTHAWKLELCLFQGQGRAQKDSKHRQSSVMLNNNREEWYILLPSEIITKRSLPINFYGSHLFLTPV